MIRHQTVTEDLNVIRDVQRQNIDVQATVAGSVENRLTLLRRWQTWWGYPEQ